MKKTSAVPSTSLPRNAKGGILFERKALEPAWRILTQDVDHKAGLFDSSVQVSANKVKIVLSTFYPSITLKEVEWMLGGQESVNFDQLHSLIKDNVLDESIDPIKEAFVNLCEDDENTIHMDKVLELFEEMGTTGLNRKVIEQTFDLVIHEDPIMSLTKRECDTMPFTQHLHNWYNEKEGRKKINRDQRIIVKDRHGIEIVHKVDTIKEEGHTTYKDNLDNVEFMADLFPIEVFLKDPWKLKKKDLEMVDKHEITLEMFRQFVSFGQDEDEDPNMPDQVGQTPNQMNAKMTTI